ncbi:c-type cytochrome [Kaarinaea lacus]
MNGLNNKFFLVNMTLVLAVLVCGQGNIYAEKKYRYAEEPWGRDSPAGRCVVCHSLEKNGPFRVAPNLWGIIGAEKARAKGSYAYSVALNKKGGFWTPEELDQFLADPDKYLPGTKKSIRVKSPEERQKIIDYLKELKD